jgi:hypothetical protein
MDSRRMNVQTHGAGIVTAIAVLLSGASAILVAQPSVRHTASPDEIRKHIDRKWFLNSMLHDNLEHWLTAGSDAQRVLPNQS